MKKTSSLPGPPPPWSSATNSVRFMLLTVKIEDWICNSASVRLNMMLVIVPWVASCRKERLTDLSSSREACSLETPSCERFISFWIAYSWFKESWKVAETDAKSSSYDEKPW